MTPVFTKKLTTRAALTAFLTLLAFERWTVYNTPLSGLDGSWAIAIHLAHQLKLIHGTEFVFTYGPLSWLVTRLPIGIPAWPLILFDVVYLVNVAGVLWLAAGNRLTVIHAITLTTVVALNRQTAGMETPFMFYYFILVSLFFHQRTGRVWFLGWAVGLAVLTFYLKANVGLVSLGSVVIYGLWQAVATPRYKVACLSAIVVLFFLLVLSACFLPVDLYPFVVGHWHLITSYNDAMYALEDKPALLAGLLILALSFSLVGFVIVRTWKNQRLDQLWQRDGCLLFLTMLMTFVLFKQSFLRADAGHTGLFFKHGLLPFSLLFLYCDTYQLRRIAVVPILLTVLTAPALVPYHRDAGVLYRWIPQWTAYVQDVINPARPQMTPMRIPWPARWLTRMKGQRVDVMPDDVALIYDAQLHYAPRPVIQTYQVTDGYLDSLNAAYYLSPRAPEYVLLTMSSVDNRDPFADETLTKLSLLRAYAVTDVAGDWLLLQRRSVPLALSFIKKETTTEQLNKPVSVSDQSGLIQLWQVEGSYSIIGSVAKLFFQPPRLDIRLTRRNGEQMTFRAALPLLRTGILLPAHPRDVLEISHYLRTNGHVPDSSATCQIELKTDPRLPDGFKPLITLTRHFYRVN